MRHGQRIRRRSADGSTRGGSLALATFMLFTITGLLLSSASQAGESGESRAVLPVAVDTASPYWLAQYEGADAAGAAIISNETDAMIHIVSTDIARTIRIKPGTSVDVGSLLDDTSAFCEVRFEGDDSVHYVVLKRGIFVRVSGAKGGAS